MLDEPECKETPPSLSSNPQIFPSSVTNYDSSSSSDSSCGLKMKTKQKLFKRHRRPKTKSCQQSKGHDVGVLNNTYLVLLFANLLVP